MASVYVLFHTHHISEDEDDDKLLGIYSSRDLAENKIETLYKKTPGFSEENGEFIVSEYEVDSNYWTEGFSTVYLPEK